MRKLATMCCIAAVLVTLLSACVTQPGAPVATARPASRAIIQARLAPLCPTPSQLSSSQLDAVAEALERGPSSPGLDLLATEYERLNDASKVCRGQR